MDHKKLNLTIMSVTQNAIKSLEGEYDSLIQDYNAKERF